MVDKNKQVQFIRDNPEFVYNLLETALTEHEMAWIEDDDKEYYDHAINPLRSIVGWGPLPEEPNEDYDPTALFEEENKC